MGTAAPGPRDMVTERNCGQNGATSSDFFQKNPKKSILFGDTEVSQFWNVRQTPAKFRL